MRTRGGGWCLRRRVRTQLDNLSRTFFFSSWFLQNSFLSNYLNTNGNGRAETDIIPVFDNIFDVFKSRLKGGGPVGGDDNFAYVRGGRGGPKLVILLRTYFMDASLWT